MHFTRRRDGCQEKFWRPGRPVVILDIAEKIYYCYNCLKLLRSLSRHEYREHGQVNGNGELCNCTGVLRHLPDLCGVYPPDQRERGPGAEAADLHHVRLAGAEYRLPAGSDRPYGGGCRNGDNGGKRGLRLCPPVLLLVHIYLLLRSPPKKAAGPSWRHQLFGAAHGVL